MVFLWFPYIYPQVVSSIVSSEVRAGNYAGAWDDRRPYLSCPRRPRSGIRRWVPSGDVKIDMETAMEIMIFPIKNCDVPLKTVILHAYPMNSMMIFHSQFARGYPILICLDITCTTINCNGVCQPTGVTNSF